jgi:hypothetical protein
MVRNVYAAGPARFKIALVGGGGRGTGAAAEVLRLANHSNWVTIADAFRDRAELSRKSLL